GLRFYKHLLQPFAFLLPLMLLEDLVKPVSLTLRLYGNIFGEETVTSSFFNLVPIGLPVVMQMLSVLMGLVQALVFALLTGIYIKEALPEEEEHL
ncbi:MAG: F0F1 ATP synthase subunit A, partial [Clostridia bacterium]